LEIGLIDQCVILLGGLGTRLGAVGKATPKPLLEVGGTPFVEVLIAEARRRGFRNFVLLAGHKSERVHAFLVERDIEKRFDCRVVLSVEPTPFGTGGALVHALPLLAEEFLLLNGDTWFDFNWRDLVARARSAGAMAALSLRHVERPDRYETVARDGDRVAQIHPRRHDLATATINGGVYYLTRRRRWRPICCRIWSARADCSAMIIPAFSSTSACRKRFPPPIGWCRRSASVQRFFSTATACSISIMAMSTRPVRSTGSKARVKR
jgi:choline kinase